MAYHASYRIYSCLPWTLLSITKHIAAAHKSTQNKSFLLLVLIWPTRVRPHSCNWWSGGWVLPGVISMCSTVGTLPTHIPALQCVRICSRSLIAARALCSYITVHTFIVQPVVRVCARVTAVYFAHNTVWCDWLYILPFFLFLIFIDCGWVTGAPQCALRTPAASTG
jgi:hypothetical protein